MPRSTGSEPPSSSADRGHQADDRRMVDVAPVEVPAAVEKVQLVAEVAVAVCERQVKQQLRAAHQQQ